ncbi:MAG TPA: FoF1 ATP synthase subunit a [Myxococcaceae bacterium]|nr:FoF1 ATP synthase subunit a [Myxococcaceae bacterium]
MPEALANKLPYVVLLNFLVVCSLLLVLGRIATARPLKELPGGIQNAAELVLDWFVAQARSIDPRAVPIIAPFLASLFLVILLSNLLGVLPVPVLQIPPTAYYSVPLSLAAIAVLGALVIGAKLRGITAGLKHLVWPNPLQLVEELSHTLSLSLRLYGNIGGEFIVALLVAQVVPYGIPLLVHALGLFPAVIQPFVFTLLTANVLSTALQRGEKPKLPEEAMNVHRITTP